MILHNLQVFVMCDVQQAGEKLTELYKLIRIKVKEVHKQS